MRFGVDVGWDHINLHVGYSNSNKFFAGTFKAMVIFSKLSKLGPWIPRSILLMDSIVKPTFSASSSWVNPVLLRTCCKRLPNCFFNDVDSGVMRATLKDTEGACILLKLNFGFNEAKLRVVVSGQLEPEWSQIMKEQARGELNLSFLSNYLLEDEIYLQLDKLQALVSLQTLLNTAETTPTRAQHLYYAMTVEEQVGKLRELVDELFR